MAAPFVAVGRMIDMVGNLRLRKHLKLDVIQVFEPQRGVVLEIWPADADAEVGS
jgi:hypothetical protein